MSRIGRQPIEIPGGVDVVVDGSRVAVTGPRGSLEQTFHAEVVIRKDDGTTGPNLPGSGGAGRPAAIIWSGHKR